jgi:hypothetical protein
MLFFVDQVGRPYVLARLGKKSQSHKTAGSFVGDINHICELLSDKVSHEVMEEKKY